MTATATQPPIGEVMAVRPDDTAVASQIDGWLLAYARNRDPVLRERISQAQIGQDDPLPEHRIAAGGVGQQPPLDRGRSVLVAWPDVDDDRIMGTLGDGRGH
jgi:hypothetical protein